MSDAATDSPPPSHRRLVYNLDTKSDLEDRETRAEIRWPPTSLEQRPITALAGAPSLLEIPKYWLNYRYRLVPHAGPPPIVTVIGTIKYSFYEYKKYEDVIGVGYWPFTRLGTKKRRAFHSYTALTRTSANL
jgi:hypothetical protein